MTRSVLLRAGAAAVILLVAVVGVAVALAGGDEREPAVRAADGLPRPADLQPCRGLSGTPARECQVRQYLAAIGGRQDPRPAVKVIADSIWREGGSVLANCHGAMHTVGRTYAREAGVSLATLKDYLPRQNDPGCTAGFAHGVVTAVAPDIDTSSPEESAAVCQDAGTRFQRYSCVHGFGHAFMRLYADELAPALELCRQLGRQTAADCAQGAFHDYWFAIAGADDAPRPADPVRSPATLCLRQEPAFVRPCWYRAFIDNRPAGFQVEAAQDIDDLCDGLAGVQREGCVTAASVIGPPDPAEQIEICRDIPGVRDAASCVHGVKVQNLLGQPTDRYVALIERCGRHAGAPWAECYRWLGKVLTVITDGRFAREGCPRLRGDARRSCERGAGELEGALVTFS